MGKRELENKQAEASMQMPYTHPMPEGTVVFVLMQTHDGFDRIIKQARAKVIHEEEEFVTVEFIVYNKKHTAVCKKENVDTSPHIVPYV